MVILWHFVIFQTQNIQKTFKITPVYTLLTNSLSCFDTASHYITPELSRLRCNYTNLGSRGVSGHVTIIPSTLSTTGEFEEITRKI